MEATPSKAPIPESTTAAAPGMHSLSIEADGITRWFAYYVPRGYDGRAVVPLLFAFHGAGGSMQEMTKDRTDLVALADRDSVIVVMPNGQNETGNRGSATWNAVWCCGYAHQANKSDVEFVRRMVQVFEAGFKIDAKRVYAMGFSNGGMLTYRVAAEMPDVFASVTVFGAAAGGSSTLEPTKKLTVPTKPVPLLIMHGQDDRTAPIEGGESEKFDGLIYISQAENLAIYTQAYHCKGDPAGSVVQGRKGRILVNQYAGCDADLVTVLMENVAHGWPDTDFAGFDGTLQAWDFLAAHPRP